MRNVEQVFYLLSVERGMEPDGIRSNSRGTIKLTLTYQALSSGTTIFNTRIDSYCFSDITDRTSYI